MNTKNARESAAVPEDDLYVEDKAVDHFAKHMKHKLCRARERGKSGWQDRAWTPEQISQALREHVEKGDPVDVANYCMFLAARQEFIYPQPPAPASAAAPTEWHCFHCGEVFTTFGSARDHFGAKPDAEPGCLIDQVVLEEGGRPERGRGLLMALRKAEAELERYREEDTDLHHSLLRLEADHQTELMRSEEIGYARGLKDANHVEPATQEQPS